MTFKILEKLLENTNKSISKCMNNICIKDLLVFRSI